MKQRITYISLVLFSLLFFAPHVPMAAESYYSWQNNWEWIYEHVFKNSDDHFYGGDGTKERPYRIWQGQHLAKLAYDVNVRHITYKGKYFQLATNINLQDFQVDGNPTVWIPIGINHKYPFEGYFDGDGKTISNMIVEAKGGREENFSWGLFGASRGVVRNVNVKSATIRLSSNGSNIKNLYAGVLCGYLCNDNAVRFGAVYGCRVEGTISGKMTDNIGDRGAVGGLVGYADNPVSIYRCHSAVSIRVSDVRSIGGIVGFLNGYNASHIEQWRLTWGPLETFVFDCTAHVSIEADEEQLDHYHAGGICGDSNGGNIEACASSGSITTAKNGTSAGICARNRGNVIGCASVARLTGGWNVGGIVGKNEDTSINGKRYFGRIAYCTYSGHIDGTQSLYAGGIAARSSFVGETNSLFLGTMKVAASCKTHPISQPTGEQREENNQRCYFDLNLYNAVADKDATALPIATLTNGQSSSLPLTGVNVTSLKNTYDALGAIEVTGVGYQFVEGCYPRLVVANSNNTTSGPMTDTAIDRAKDAWGDNTELKTPALFPSYALLASVPLGFSNSNEAYHLDAAFSVANKTVDGQTFTYNLSAPYGSVHQEGTTVTPLYPDEATLSVVSAEGLSKAFALNLSSGEQWDGTIATNYGDGSGQAGNPYLIYNVRQFVKAMRDNKANEYYKLMGDIWFNKDLFDDNAKPRVGKYAWERQSTDNLVWSAHLDGNGHLVHGLHATNTYGIFNEIAGTAVIENIGFVNCRVETPNVYPAQSGFLSKIIHGGAVVRNCMFEGIMHCEYPYATALCFDYENTAEAVVTIEDCLIAVQFSGDMDYTVLGGVGNISKSTNRAIRCLVLTANSNIHFAQDVTRTEQTFYHQGYAKSMYVGEDENYALSAEALTSGRVYKDSERWLSEPGRYPMLQTFAKTSYARLLSLPVYATIDNRICNMVQSVEFGHGSTAWSSNNDYVEVDNDALVMVPLKVKDCYLVRQLDDAKVLLPISVSGNSKMGVAFADEHAKNVCLTNFDTDKNQILTLRELSTVTATSFDAAMTASATEANLIEKFRELSYFTGIKALGTADGSGEVKPFKNLRHLKDVRLPGNITALYDGAFEGCNDLESVTLPAKVTKVAGHPFYGSSVVNILVDSLNPVYESRNGILMTKTNDLVCYPNGRSGTSITLSGTIDNILPHAIYKVAQVDTVFIDNPGTDKLTFLQEGGITHYSGEPRMRIFINDGSNDGTLYRRYMDNDTWADMADAGQIGRYYPLVFNDAKAATLYLGFDTQLPADLRVYLVSKDDSSDEQALLLNISNKIGNKLAKNTPVVIRSPYMGIVKLFPYAGADATSIPLYLNALNGVGEKGMAVNQGDSNEGNCLTLGRNSQQQLGFFYYKNNFIQPFHAYLTVNTISACMAVFSDEGTPDQESEADLYDDLFAYKMNDDGQSCRAVWYYGTPQNVTIPAEVEGIPVTALGKNLFYDNERPIWSVAVPSSIQALRVARKEKNNPFFGLSDDVMIYLPEKSANYSAPDDEWNVVMGDECKLFHLADGQSFCPPHDFNADYVLYNRQLWAETNIVYNYGDGEVDSLNINRKDGTEEALGREANFDLFDIQYSRKAYTLCLPFDVDLTKMSTNDESDLKAYQLKYVKDNLHFIFVEVSRQLKAGQPYFIVVNGGGYILLNDQRTKVSADLHPLTVTDYNTGAVVGLYKGTAAFVSNEEAVADHAFIIQSTGNWHRVNNQTEKQRKVTIWPNRSYFSRTDGFTRNRYFTNYKSEGSNARLLGATNAEEEVGDFPADAYYSDIDFEVDDDPTGILPIIHTIDLDGTERLYDLNGRSFNSKPSKGIFIKNGKKYIQK